MKPLLLLQLYRLLCILLILLPDSAFAVSPLSAAPYQPPHYLLTVLPGPATAISDTGWVVGKTAGQRVYRWKEGKSVGWIRNQGCGQISPEPLCA